MNKKIRDLENNLLDVLNNSDVPTEGKRVVLALLATRCEIMANEEIAQEIQQPIVEEGEMKDA